MNKDKSNLLDSFYNIKSEKKFQNKVDSAPHPATKVVTYSLKEENIKYVELRATHFSSKAAMISRSTSPLFPSVGNAHKVISVLASAEDSLLPPAKSNVHANRIHVTKRIIFFMAFSFCSIFSLNLQETIYLYTSFGFHDLSPKIFK